MSVGKDWSINPEMVNHLLSDHSRDDLIVTIARMVNEFPSYKIDSFKNRIVDEWKSKLQLDLIDQSEPAGYGSDGSLHY